MLDNGNADREAAQQVRDLGEQGLLQRLQRFCPADIVGDDGALLSVSEAHLLVVTSDTLVDGVHFSLGMALPDIHTTSAYDTGWRAAAANLSDLAAMGAAPLGITVGLGLPGDLPVACVENLYQGMASCLKPFNTPIVGGDICRSPVISLNITALGQVLPHQAIRRSTAQPGDRILITGVHGASRAGLELLLHPEQGQSLQKSDRDYLVSAHQRPIPRLDVIPLLHAVALGAHSWTGMDSSDGLADAILQICRASQVGAEIDLRQIPPIAGTADWISASQALEWALYGGEDFELVLCLPPAIAQALLELIPGGAIVGTITAQPIVVLQDSAGRFPDRLLSLDRGFQHFA
ncbi:MAG TPA: thiamine-phosphate kinase [Coleofasciculaceae cyanobacterium]